MRYAHIFCGWSKRLKPNESRALSGPRYADYRATQTLLRSFALIADFEVCFDQQWALRRTQQLQTLGDDTNTVFSLNFDDEVGAGINLAGRAAGTWSRGSLAQPAARPIGSR
jgi:hypothetical protein